MPRPITREARERKPTLEEIKRRCTKKSKVAEQLGAWSLDALMANPPRNRKRVRAVRRAPDGSAFRKCNSCGVSVAIALADLHECETKKVVVQRFRGVSERPNVVKPTFGDQPRSAFRVFMESFVKTCKTINVITIDQNGLDTWKNMSKEERKPYIIEAERVNHSYGKALLEEVDNLQEDLNDIKDMLQVNDEADSAMVGKFDQFYEGYEDYENSNSFDSFQSVETE
ncbi:hypothetical protein I3843_01G296000 [Carya illinoinensis]|nr:high mobility group B protein 7 isoform X1 [Carya illinoinensis]XP_042956895.1 high mobility group B protein 7 isoform X1 [Carya illinoinensis]KAG2730598.1 hypothetical protein I3760_01G302100 [Carya illinoinensis]KAG2730599.1 hypothetical protein I3760_01G302100 [Carya illinoinensis]KAG7999193.1 hypothetical protein I3843_01G296000 [Carya illinoinensis]